MGKQIAIIGAGPAGSYFGYLMAKEGYEVDIYEDNEEVGVPMQCTGIVTGAIEDIVKLPDHLVFNRLKFVRVVAPNGKAVKIKNSDLVIDRIGFDQHIAKMAEQAGARVHRRHRFTGLVGEELVIKGPHGELRRKADVLVGADGPNSTVAKATGIFGEREYYIGAQTRMERAFDRQSFEVHFDVPQFFGWSVPENASISRVGMGVFKVPNKHFKEVLAKYGEHNKKVGNQGGLIPVYNPKLKISTKVGKMPVYLAGDAATFVKATTGGGIVQGMIGAQVLRDCIIRGGRYERKIKWALKKDLWLHLFIRDTLNKFTYGDYNELVRMLRKPKVQHVLATESRDYPLRFLIKLFFAQPQFLKFAPIVLRKNLSGPKQYEQAMEHLVSA